MSNLAVVVTVLLGGAALGAAADWPQWQGPDRTRISKETGLLEEWPAGGPRLMWTAKGLGSGFWVDGRRRRSCLFARHARPQQCGHRTQPDGWQRSLVQGLSVPLKRTIGDQDRAAHRRSTATGFMRSAKMAIWHASRSTALRCGSAISSVISAVRSRNWLISESPLVDGPHVVVSPGGRGATDGEVGQDDGADRLDVQGSQRSGFLTRPSSPRTCKVCART